MLSDKELVELLQDTFKIGYESYESSRKESARIWDLYHNRHYTVDQENILANRGQPAETFNVIKLFTRMMLGYYSTVINMPKAKATKLSGAVNAALLSDAMSHVFRTNAFMTEGDKIKLGGLISGLLISYQRPIKTGKKDRFGRPEYRTEFQYVPDSQCVLDPSSTKDDYSDADYFHRFKWLKERIVTTRWPGKLEELEEYYNHLNVDEAEFEYSYNGQFTGYYRIHNNYLVVHSVIELDDGTRWSVHWSGDVILEKKEITKNTVRFPYRVQKVHTSDRAEYYGVFREVEESQHAINQALIKLQLLINSNKVFVEEGAVDDIDEFTAAYNKVTGVIPVTDLGGIKVENLSAEVADQYVVIDRAFDRIQRVLSINDSFLGQAFASDSGRKVKLQQNSAVIALNYLTNRISEFYRVLGWDIAKIIQQYYTAEQMLLISDVNGDRYAMLNKPIEIPTGEMDEQGNPVLETQFEYVEDPDTGEPMVDEQGNHIIAPIPEPETEVKFTDFEIEMETVAYNDEDEKNQLMMETVLAGPAGQLLSQVNPAGYFKIYGLAIKSMKTRFTPEISEIFAQTAQLLGGDPAQQEEAKQIAQGNGPGSGGNQVPLSQSMKLPQNTNEDAV